MTFVEFLLVLVQLCILAVVVLAANYADRTRSPRMSYAVIGLLLLLNVFFAMTGVLSLLSAYGLAADSVESLDRASAWGGMFITFGVATLGTALVFRAFRERIAGLFPRFQTKSKHSATDFADHMLAAPALHTQAPGEPLFPQMLNYYTTTTPQPGSRPNMMESAEGVREWSTDHNPAYRVRGFDPTSHVHMLAIIFVLYLLGSQFYGFIVGGGLEGLAETYEEIGLDIWSLLSNSLPLIILPFLGVGLGLRRNFRQSLARLGLGPLTGKGLAISLGMTFMLFAGLFVIGLIWITIVPEDVYNEQTRATEALSESVDTIGLAFMLAATAAIGEEIAFRGALQPVIGFWPTAIVFALTHTQYTLTPAWLIILVVAVAFGWIRQRYNTTVAILTHFWYNLFQLLLLFVAPEETIEAILHIVQLG